MVKLIIQIPCLNEAESLPETLARLPRRIDGVDVIEFLVIDDGSSDDTANVARRHGAHHVETHRRNRGLAAAFRSGIDKALAEGADIIVNTDGDGQYEGADIAALVTPVVEGRADIVIGDRGVADNAHFSVPKRLMQRIGSGVVQSLAGTKVTDAVSGFRAISRDAAQRINITTEFSYTTDMLIQAGRKRMAILTVPVRTHAAVRPSRLFKSIPRFISQTGITMIRAFTAHKPLRAFVGTGSLIAFIGLLPILRFLWFFAQGDGTGHIQSLVIGGALLVLGTLVAIMGMVADLVAANRKLIEENLRRTRALEDRIAELQSDAPAKQERKRQDAA
ncbi:glycosyltransferase family 2 protein [Aurantiacibacter sp. D1-12]|uniref:glycosyltransferase family 2 protein n=1 Tax=Aurantiacibacter sp. D1-12 TaxID=2993658 RepID=UPI00237CB9CE|nr:glycosyltransferase family 2 protein [Aurantiacibacter sp. D1-12]MDE1466340.1 glycosyltransferase family 2 protein [Aurantiacibacter sp. D1-12]